jgi:hypothetical protein
MNIIMIVFTVLLFVLLTPGVILSLPPKGTLLTQAVVHGLVFALVYHFTHKAVWLWSKRVDGYDDMEAPPQMSGAPEGAMCKTSDQCLSGQCNDGICA